jgi:outer membrane lipoprotein-sorting protein
MNEYLRVVSTGPEGEPVEQIVNSGPDHMADRFMQKNAATGSGNKVTLTAMVTALTFAAAGTTNAQSTPSAEEVVKRELAAFYYTGKDMSAKVSMRLINAQGNVRERNMTMLRANSGDSGEQNYLMTFSAPADVRGMGFLIAKHPKADDDRWVYFPALKAVKRIAADDKKSSFVGSDFTYEDVSGRDLNEEQHALLRTDEVGGRKVYVVESKPKGATDYAKRQIWVDQERSLPLKEEYFDHQGKLIRTFAAEKVEQIGGNWTITSRTMKNAQTGHRTEVTFSNVEYNVGLKDDVFTERTLKNPGLVK